MPEMMDLLRNELASLLRTWADKEADETVATRLREVASAFESDAGPADRPVLDVNQQHDGAFALHCPLTSTRPAAPTAVSQHPDSRV